MTGAAADPSAGPWSITSRTRLFAVLGDPVEHSLSPVLQNAAFREAGMDGVYVALRTGEAELGSVMRTLAMNGGGGNVTLPFKEHAATCLDEPSEEVRRTGACNTFWYEGGRLRGDNTDVEGFRRALSECPGPLPSGARVLVLGAGGAARAVLTALLQDGVVEVVLLNRSAARAHALARDLGGGRTTVAERPDELEGEPFHLLVNATRLGLNASDPLPLELATLGPLGGVLDLVYGHESTRLVRDALSLGIPAADGRGMLLHQGAAAFEHWWKRKAPLEAMRSSLPVIPEAL